MFRIAAISVLAIGLFGSDAFALTMIEGFSQAKAVESDLEKSTGIRPEVGFNTINQRLVTVRVVFPSVYEGRRLADLAEAVRTSVTTQFTETPEKVALSFTVVKCVTACNAVYPMSETLRHTKDVESDLEQSTGVRPEVDFNWINGRLVGVGVSFPRVYDGKPLGELAEAVRSSVTTQFKLTPENILLSFAVGK
jgi:hypothetical protein